jgi:2-hydroxyacyl-CoA lyase 1
VERVLTVPTSEEIDGYTLIAASLRRLGLEHVYGVVGIPITFLATAVQNTGTRFFGMHNEQAASMAAGAAGYLTALPGVCLSVSGPGVVNALAGLANAQVNRFPMMLLSGASDGVHSGEFQALDQVTATKPYCKLSLGVKDIREVPGVIEKVAKACIDGVPGAGYVDLPSRIMRQMISWKEAETLVGELQALTPIYKQTCKVDQDKLRVVVSELQEAKKPLVVIGKGAAYSQSEEALLNFITKTGIPFLSQPMAKGMLPDRHKSSANAARSLAQSSADVVLVIGARMNWMLAFGAAPKWNAQAKFILVDIDMDELNHSVLGVCGDARTVLNGLCDLWTFGPQFSEWRREISQKSASAIAKLDQRLLQECKGAMDYHATLGVIKRAIQQYSPNAVIVSEGANTMDMARMILDMDKPRHRLDAGTWGTMGVGMGYAIAASTVQKDLVIAIEGDSAFGFSAMECEVIARYQLPVVVFVFNNGGVYGGDRRTDAEKQSDVARNDPPPTSFTIVRYDLLMQSLGGKGYRAESVSELEKVCQEALTLGKPAVVDILIDPLAGSESGRLHSMN